MWSNCVTASTFLLGAGAGATGLRITPQAEIAKYRVDFLLTLESVSQAVTVFERHLVLECDGAEFHDVTAEQLIRDRRRDRQLQIAGYPVFRYSGSEIWKDVFGVAREVVGFLKASLEQERSAALRKGPEAERNGGSMARAATVG